MIPSSRKIFNYFGRELLNRENRKIFGRTYQNMVSASKKSNYLNEIGKNIWSGKAVLNNYNRTISTMLEVHREADFSKIEPLGLTLEEVHAFLGIFSELEPDIIGAQRCKDLPEIACRLERLTRTALPDTRRTAGLVLLAAYKRLEQPERLSWDGIREAMILGWCMELMEGFFNITDDIMDAGEKRHGKPCWYKQEGVGLSAINDSLLLEQGIYSLLHTHFSQHPCYIPVMKIFHRIILETCIGQSIDVMTYNNGSPNFDAFTMDRYKLICQYKSGFISYLPIALAMYLSQIFDEEQHRQVESLFLHFGHSIQVRNDYVDCFDALRMGKGKGTDIQEGKCTWLAVMALQRASATQRRILQEHYGRQEEDSVSVVRKLYEELDLRNAFSTYLEEDERYLFKQVHHLCEGLPKDLFNNIIYSWLEGENNVRSCNAGGRNNSRNVIGGPTLANS